MGTQGELDTLIADAFRSGGRITALTGAGISAESGIPTFRGPEGYWTVGSKVYHPQEMATMAMFRRNPQAVWQWYLYRLGICRNAQPNAGHHALVQLEKGCGDRFTLITQNVDQLHLRAGHRHKTTYQIHGNIGYVRCSQACNHKIRALPEGVTAKTIDAAISENEWQRLHCTQCGALLRPHVLWFDETYNEIHYRLESALTAAYHTDLLLVVGTSGATNLPNQIVSIVHQRNGVIIDLNIGSNPFGSIALASPNGCVVREKSAEALPWIVESILAENARMT